MSNVTFAPARRADTLPGPRGPDLHQGGPDSTFWSPPIGSGAAAIVALCPHVDVLSQRIGQLPVRAALTRPVVGQYLTMLKSLAAAWGAHTRPSLVAAMGSLVHVGDSMGQSFALEAMAARRADNGRAALRVLDALLRRLAAPLAGFDALDRDFGSYLRQMAAVSGELDADTLLVAQRLQADHVHAFLLSQQASTLQSKLDDASMRAHDWWLLGPHAGAVRQEICLHTSALEGVRRQLDQLRAEQAATRAEADYLQSLLPGLSTYLATVDRMGAAIGAVLAGTRALARELAALKQAMEGDPAGAGDAGQQLSAALPHWHALVSSGAALRPGALS